MLDDFLDKAIEDRSKELCVLCGIKGHFHEDCKYYKMYMKDYPKFKHKWSKEEYFNKTLKKWIEKNEKMNEKFVK